MDACLNKPFKAIFEKMLGNVSSVVESFPEVNSNSSFKLLRLTFHHMIDYVREGFDHLV